MSDTQLRELERRALETGDVRDVLPYLRAYIRTVIAPDTPVFGSDLHAASLTLRSNPAEPISQSGTLSLRNNNGVIEISENSGAWVRLAKEIRTDVVVPQVVNMQASTIVAAIQALTDAVVEAGIARRP